MRVARTSLVLLCALATSLLLTITGLRTITDLKANSTNPPTRVKRKPGTSPWYQFTFVVGPPVP